MDNLSYEPFHLWCHRLTSEVTSEVPCRWEMGAEQVQSCKGARKVETQRDSALGIRFLYSRDKEEDSGKEVRKPCARKKSGYIRMGSLHRGHNEVTAQGTFTYVSVRTGFSCEVEECRGDNTQASNDLEPRSGYGKESPTEYCPSGMQRSPNLTSEVLLRKEGVV